LANKAALSCRVDALGNESTLQIGQISLQKITSRLKEMDVTRKTPDDKKRPRALSTGDEGTAKRKKN
jgi:RNA processing factor Prp31